MYIIVNDMTNEVEFQCLSKQEARDYINNTPEPEDGHTVSLYESTSF